MMFSLPSLVRVAIAIGSVLLYSACGEIKTGPTLGDAGGDAPAVLGCAAACGPSATCIDEAGTFACRCAAGFVGDGVLCVNINECVAGTHACDPSTKCTDKAPLYECTPCPAGTLDVDPGIGTKCQGDVPDSVQVLAAGAMALESCGTVANGDLDGDGIDGSLAAALLVNGANGKDAEGYGRNPLRPFKTIAHAIAVAQVDLDRNQIYVASQDAAHVEIVYAENVRLPRGVSLYGGYQSDFKKRDPAMRTRVAPSSGVPFVADYTTDTVGGTFVVEGFVFEASAGTSGVSSVAAILQDSPASLATPDAGVPDAAGDAGVGDAGVGKGLARVRLINTTLIAKNGGSGADGKRPEQGLNGCPGKSGAPQVTMRTVGFESTDRCFVGAPGGYGGASQGYVGEDGGPSGNVPGGLGGKKNSAGFNVCWCPNTVADPGQPGNPGSEPTPNDRPAAPVQPVGDVTWSSDTFAWTPHTGDRGVPGFNGLGGSGGGASFGACGTPGNVGSCVGANGSSGGSGGGGGQGGPGGDGGKGGGASIGLLVAHGAPTLACVNIKVGNGGNGGKGGPGAGSGRGGPGGRGGDPIPVGNNRTGPAGPGGKGSDGRPGLAGQGGRGGVSVGVLLYSSIAVGLDTIGSVDTNSVVTGQPGLGGPEITGSEPGYPGLPGVSSRVLTLP